MTVGEERGASPSPSVNTSMKAKARTEKRGKRKKGVSGNIGGGKGREKK